MHTHVQRYVLAHIFRLILRVHTVAAIKQQAEMKQQPPHSPSSYLECPDKYVGERKSKC